MLQAAGHAGVNSSDSLRDAFQDAKKASAAGDVILIFGSFRVVGEALKMVML